jgi:hypothetical protein
LLFEDKKNGNHVSDSEVINQRKPVNETAAGKELDEHPRKRP